MILISFFSALILFLNLVLYFVYQRLDFNLQKYNFWVMVSSGIAWVGSLVVFLLQPDQTVNIVQDQALQLLPVTILTLDRISSSLIMAIQAIIFAGSLFQDLNPRQLAWISGLGAICSLGVLSNSVFTVILALTLVEIFLLVNFIAAPERSESTRRKLMAVIGRLLSPILMLVALLLSGPQSSELSFSGLNPEVGLILLAAGLIGAPGWFGFLENKPDDINDLIPRQYTEILPGSIALMVIIRAGQIISPGSSDLLPGALVVVLAVVGAVFVRPGSSWTLALIGLVAGAAYLGDVDTSLAWSLVFLIPGYILSKKAESSWQNILLLTSGGIGVICLPFLPAWRGVDLFNNSVGGVLLAIGLGLSAGLLLTRKVSELIENRHPRGAISPPYWVGAGVLLGSQLILAYGSGLLAESLDLAKYPIVSWLPGLVMVLVGLMGYRLPDLTSPAIRKLAEKLETFSSNGLTAGTNSLDKVVTVMTDLFEGEGGLIWTLLIAFLIITLISRGGG